MTQTQRQKVAAELAAVKSAAERSRAAGRTDEPYSREIGRLQGELDELNKINEQARPVVEAIDRRERERQQAEEHAAGQRQNRREREFKEALDCHYKDRLNFFRQKMPGLPEQDFAQDIWPELRAQYVAGEEDAVDRERREHSTSVF